MPVGMALDILEHADMSVFSSASTWSSLLTGVASSAFWLLIIIAAFWLLIIIAAWFCCRMLMSSPRYLSLGLNVVVAVLIEPDHGHVQGLRPRTRRCLFCACRTPCSACRTPCSCEPGHSHDPQDQRFSIIAATLAQCRVLQSPEDFVVTIRRGLKPIRGRPVFADILPGTWDWQQFFDDLGFNASGIAASYHHPIVCFSKRFLQLRDLPKLNLPGWELEVPALFKDTTRHPQDVVTVSYTHLTLPTIA